MGKKDTIMKGQSVYIANTPFQSLMSFVIREKYDLNENAMLCIVGDGNKLNINPHIINSKFTFIRFLGMPKDNFGILRENVVKKNIRKVLGTNRFDTLYICLSNFTHDVENLIYTVLLNENREIEVNGYIEGYSSYNISLTNDWKQVSLKHRLFLKILKFFGIRSNISKIDHVYAYHPEWFSEKVGDEYIDMSVSPDLSMDIIMEINQFFGFESHKNVIIEKYIFFEECFSQDYGKNDDLQIVNEIAKIVGKENLIIKRHPRNKYDRFSKYGYKTMKFQNIPWELYMLDSSQTEHVLLSFSSGSLLNFHFFTHAQNKSIFLFECYKDMGFHIMDNKTVSWFYKFKERYGEEINIPKNKEQLINNLIK